MWLDKIPSLSSADSSLTIESNEDDEYNDR